MNKKSVISWLVWSSQNPQKLSMTLKGAAGFVVMAAAFFKLDGVTPESWNSTVDAVIHIISGLAMMASGAAAVSGFVRKVKRTYNPD